MHTRAHRSPSDTLEGKVKLKARERRGRRDPPPLPSPRAMTDAAEAAFLTPSPPSCCSRSFPCPRPSTPPHGARASPRPLPPRRSRRASGPGRATDGRGRWRVGAAAGGPFHRVTPDSFAQPLGESPPAFTLTNTYDAENSSPRAEKLLLAQGHTQKLGAQRVGWILSPGGGGSEEGPSEQMLSPKPTENKGQQEHVFKMFQDG
ncbi:uncharacterized protein [Manis javanica]|uniref:uncharacterized protein isoform X2 n=1 Tax=Manis javanica TaxID=9974 RepID=UPI003C6D5431